MLYDQDTRHLLARERAELLAREMQASRRGGTRRLSAPAGLRLLLAVRRLAARPRLTL